MQYILINDWRWTHKKINIKTKTKTKNKNLKLSTKQIRAFYSASNIIKKIYYILSHKFLRINKKIDKNK